MWRIPDRYQPTYLTWHGGMCGPSTAAVLANGTVVGSKHCGERYLYNSIKEAKAALPEPPDVCLSEELAIHFNSPLVYGERCSLDEISWHALGTGIASPYNIAQVLKIMITARRCRVRLRCIQAGCNLKLVQSKVPKRNAGGGASFG